MTMSAPMNQMNTSSHPSPSSYSPVDDALARHEYGVQKNKKQASTGGGRAWSEDEVCSGVSAGIMAYRTDTFVGSLPSPDSTPENAIQAHCHSLEEDRVGLSPALPSIVSRQQPPQAHWVNHLFQPWFRDALTRHVKFHAISCQRDN